MICININAIINSVGTIFFIIIIIIMVVVIPALECRGKEKNAQEGHGAVAPVDPMIIPEAIFLHMEKVQGAISIPSELTKAQKKLYEMIWRHTLASQMKIAHLNQVGRQLYGSLVWSGITSEHAVSCMMDWDAETASRVLYCVIVLAAGSHYPHDSDTMYTVKYRTTLLGVQIPWGLAAICNAVMLPMLANEQVVRQQPWAWSKLARCCLRSSQHGMQSNVKFSSVNGISFFLLSMICIQQQQYTWHAVNCGGQHHRWDLYCICSTLVGLCQQRYAWHAVECGDHQHGWKPEAEGIGVTGRVCWLPQSLRELWYWQGGLVRQAHYL